VTVTGFLVDVYCLGAKNVTDPEVMGSGSLTTYVPMYYSAFAWRMLLQAGGLAQLTGGRLVLTTRGQTALTRPPHLTIVQLGQRWPNNSLLDEFSRVEEIKGRRSANVLTAAEPRRKLVGQAPADLTPGERTSVGSLFADMRAAGLDPVVHRSEPVLWKLYLEDPRYGGLGYDGYHGWSVLQGRYTLAVLFEYAATLGLIDIEYVPPAGARAVRSMRFPGRSDGRISAVRRRDRSREWPRRWRPGHVRRSPCPSTRRTSPCPS
jgi:hypothetical protein